MARALHRDEKGAAIMEFALAAPALLMFIVGIAQLGMLCMADAGLRSAVAEGARTASIFPTPDDATILARIDDAAWGMQAAHMGEPQIERDTDDSDRDYIEITMTYTAPLNFIFLDLPSVPLTETRRVYAQGSGGSSSSSSGGSSSTSASSSTSSGATSSGATSTSSTSSGATSTSSTSAGSTSTSSTSTSSTSSGNGNGNGNGHGHGNGNGNGGNGNGNGHNH